MSESCKSRMVILCDRHDVLLHRVLNNIYRFFRSAGQSVSCCNVFKMMDLVRFWKTKTTYPDFIIVQDPLVLLVVFFLKPLLRKSIIYFCLEMWGHDVPNSSLSKVLRNVVFLLSNRLALFLSPVIVFPNELRRTYYGQRHWGVKRKSLVFENYYFGSSEAVQETPCSQEFRSKLDDIKKAHNVVTCYVGGIQPGRNVTMVASVFEKLSCNVCFVVAGEDRIGVSWSTAFKNGNVYYVGHLADAEIHYLYQVAKWGFMDYDNTLLNTRYCAPLKLYEYIAFGIGIISNKNYAMLQKRDLIDFYYEDSEELELVLEKLAGSEPKNKKTEQYDFSLKFEEFLNAIIDLRV